MWANLSVGPGVQHAATTALAFSLHHLPLHLRFLPQRNTTFERMSLSTQYWNVHVQLHDFWKLWAKSQRNYWAVEYCWNITSALLTMPLIDIVGAWDIWLLPLYSVLLVFSGFCWLTYYLISTGTYEVNLIEKKENLKKKNRNQLSSDYEVTVAASGYCWQHVFWLQWSATEVCSEWKDIELTQWFTSTHTV